MWTFPPFLSTRFRSNRPSEPGACTWPQIVDQEKGVLFHKAVPLAHRKMLQILFCFLLLLLFLLLFCVISIIVIIIIVERNVCGRRNQVLNSTKNIKQKCEIAPLVKALKLDFCKWVRTCREIVELFDISFIYYLFE